MVVHTWYAIITALLGLSLIMGCASNPYMSTGAAVGGGLGALTGAAINNRNPWAGAAVGGLIGGVLGGVTGEMVRQRQTPPQPQQGYYYQPAPGYGQPAPGYGSPPSRPYYGSSSSPTSPGPTYSSAPPPADSRYSQVTPPQPEGCRTPMKYAPYYY